MKRILMKAVVLKSSESEPFYLAMNLITKFEHIMCKFSTQGLEDFVAIPEIALLLLNYLSNVKNRRYRLHYSALRKLAEDSIAAFQNTAAAEATPKSEKCEVSVMELLTTHNLF